MQVVYERCCGLDVHKRTVVACRIVPGADGTPRKEIRTFGTLTSELLALADWLSEAGCTHVAMESTGVFWKPIYNLLEDQFAVLVVNAQHMKAFTTDSPQWKLGGLDRHGRGDRSDPCVVWPALAVA
jgi:transposase